jgi:hypothetical protein
MEVWQVESGDNGREDRGKNGGGERRIMGDFRYEKKVWDNCNNHCPFLRVVSYRSRQIEI